MLTQTLYKNVSRQVCKLHVTVK